MKLFSEETLAHYGIPGQKKGIRRWQYPDGRFNEEGKIRYGYKKADSKSGLTPEERNRYNQELNDYQLEKRYKEMLNEKKYPKLTKVKKVLNRIMQNTMFDSIIVSTLLWGGSKILKKNNINIEDIKMLKYIKEIADNSKKTKDKVISPIVTILKPPKK